ncbi:hypothetical protein FE257_005507 [Aspergillus nanangensis]|uniref:DNA 3'-5' helicase n=1 Tax=Aspergillus nanangensis TaxID=2582783 RepID=A0AAD4CAJ5_ASPNN|nr:hypothetical protein FE257_005507 [Aspergillus nanangensis]
MNAKSNAACFMPEDPPPAEKLRDVLHRLHRFQPRADQVEAIKTLTIDQRDLILIARTGWGKSMIFQSVPALRRGGIALLIMPLNLLEEDQVGETASAASIKKISGCIPCILNSKSNNARVRQRIMNGDFTHILLGPEIALSDKFAELLRHREFHQRLVLVAIDELHVVQQHRIDKRVPWFGTSATLDPTMLQDVIQLAGFQDKVEVIKTTIDRPDISLSIRRIEHSIASFHDLSFLLDEAVTASGQASMSQIPKTIVYMDSIAQIEAAEYQMIEWLVKLGGQRALASAAIQAYHSQVDPPSTASYYPRTQWEWESTTLISAVSYNGNSPPQCAHCFREQGELQEDMDIWVTSFGWWNPGASNRWKIKSMHLEEQNWRGPRNEEQKLRKSKVPNWARLKTRTDLIQWRKTRAAQLFHTSFFQDEDAQEALLPTPLLDNLARDGYHIQTIDDLRDRQLGLPGGSTSEPWQLLVQLQQETREQPFNNSMQTQHSVHVEVSHRLR